MKTAADRVQEFIDARDATAPQAGPGLAVTIGADGQAVKLSAVDLRIILRQAQRLKAVLPLVDDLTDAVRTELR